MKINKSGKMMDSVVKSIAIQGYHHNRLELFFKKLDGAMQKEFREENYWSTVSFIFETFLESVDLSLMPIDGMKNILDECYEEYKNENIEKAEKEMIEKQNKFKNIEGMTR